MTDPSAATPAGSSVIHDLGYRPYTGPRLGAGAIARALDPHRVPQRLRAGPVGQLQGAALHPARPQPPAGRHRRRRARVRRTRGAADRLRGVRVDHAGARRHLRSRSGPGAVLARPATRHDLALPCPAAASSAYALSRWVACSAATLVCPAAADRHPLRRRPARRAPRRRADPRGRSSRWGSPCCWPCPSPASPGSSRRGRRAAASQWSATIALLVIANGIVTAVQGISSEEGAPRSGRSRVCSRRTPLYRGLIGRLDRRRGADASDVDLDGAGLRRCVRRLSVACVAALLWRYRRVATA